MAKGKNVNFSLISKLTGRICGFVRIKKNEKFDKSKVYKRYDKNSRSHVECSLKEIKKGGTKAHNR